MIYFLVWVMYISGHDQRLGNAPDQVRIARLSITVCHLPPGTSKWNKIEHRLFSHIAMNWRGKPLVSLAAIVSLIGSTKTEKGLRVRAEIDPGEYATGVSITDAQMATVRLEKDAFHGEWNYTIRPAMAV